jgi:hypothetical protein
MGYFDIKPLFYLVFSQLINKIGHLLTFWVVFWGETSTHIDIQIYLF